MYAIVGGSGLTSLTTLSVTRTESVRTPFGEPSGALTYGLIGGREVVFLPRHGYGHTIPPHLINYRANLWALREAGVAGVFAVTSVGGIRDDFGPGKLVVPDQIIDYTHSREHTFFDGPGAVIGTAVSHIDFTWPYAAGLRQRMLEAARRAGEAVHDGGVYGATQGPRLESAAEIHRLARDGCDLVGMTGMPEAALARELGLDYACLSVVVNHAAGRGDSALAIPLAQLGEVMNGAIARVHRIVEEFVSQ